MKFQPAAAYVLEVNGWDLDRSLRWYHDHRNDCDMPQDLNAYLYDDYIEERPGKQVCTFCYHDVLRRLSHFKWNSIDKWP